MSNRAVWQIGLVVVLYGALLNVLLVSIPDQRGALAAAVSGVLMVLIAVYLTVRAVVKHHM